MLSISLSRPLRTRALWGWQPLLSGVGELEEWWITLSLPPSAGLPIRLLLPMESNTLLRKGFGGDSRREGTGTF